MPDFALRDQIHVLPKGWPGIPYLGLFGLLYVAAAWFGQSLSLLPGTSAILWLPNGLSVAVLLYCQGKAWPRLIGTLVAAEIVADVLLFNLPLPVGMALAIGNATEVFTGAWMVRKVCGIAYSFQSLHDILALVALAGGIAPLAGAAIGTMTFALAGIAPLTDTWPLWWLTDAVGTLIVAPLVLVVLQGHAKWLVLIQTRWLEMLVLLATLVAVAMIVFANEMPIFPLLLPVLLWAALRFGIYGAAVAMAVIAAVAIASTGSGSGPFAAEGFSHATRVQLLQAFLGVCAVSTLVSAALIQQHWTDFQALKQARDELEQQVAQRTDALRTSEDRFLGVAESMPGVVYQWSERADGTFGFTYASPRIAEYFHVPADRPDEVLRLIHPEDIALFRASIEASKKDLTPWKFEGRFIDARDKSVRWWRAMSQPISSTETEILFNGVLFDITEEKRTELALADSMKRLNEALLEQKALLTASPVGFGTIDENRAITSVNDAVLRMLGYTRDEIIGRQTRDFFGSMEDWQEFGREVQSQLSSREIYRTEVHYRRKDGSRFWGLKQGVRINRSDPSKGQLFAIVDISEQKAALRQQRALLDASPAGFSIVNEQRIVTSANQAMARMIGYPLEEVIGMSTRQCFVSEDHGQSFGSDGYEQMRVDGLYSAEAQYQRRDGSRFWALVQGVQIDPADASKGRLYAVVDITKQKDAENQARELSEHLELRVRERTAELAQSEARQQAMLQLSSDWYWEQDAQFRFTAPPRGSRATQTTPVGLARWEVPSIGVTPSQWEAHKQTLREHREFRDFVFGRLDQNGHPHWFAVSGEPIFDNAGQFAGYRGVARDVTARETTIAALRQSEERLELALKGSRLTLWDWDMASGQVFLNDQWANILGQEHGSSNVPIEALQALIHPDDAPQVFAMLGATLKGERDNYDVEHRVKSAQGQWKWIHSHGMVTRRDANGHALRMTGTNAYIDDRKLAEKQASELLRGLKAVLAASPAGIFTVDSQRRITLASEAMEKMFDYEAGRMLGLFTQEIYVSPEAWQWVAIEGYRQIREHGIMIREIEYRRRDGSQFWGMVQGVQIDLQRADSEFMFVIVNIEESHQARKALGLSETRFRALLDLSVDWYWEQDTEFRFTHVQGPASPLRNIDAAQILGKARWEIPVHGVSEEQWAEHRKLLSAHQPFRGFNYRMFDSNGKERAVSISGEPTFDESGRFNGYRGVGTDISAIVHGTDALRASQEQIRQLNIDLERRVLDRTRRLAAANHELEAFSYSVSHDLQAPLRRIGRYAELLTDRAGKLLDEPAREMLTSIYQASEHTRILIGDIMKLSKITQSELAPVTVNVSDLAAIVLAELAGTEEARIITTEVTADIQVDADPALLKILLDNLLGNAWKFTARTGNPRIEVRSLDPAEGSGFLVRDNGAGFDMRYAYKLFGSFQRLHGQDEFKGTGIGLAIVQRIVNLHGWAIEAEAEVGKGATFKVKTS